MHLAYQVEYRDEIAELIPVDDLPTQDSSRAPPRRVLSK